MADNTKRDALEARLAELEAKDAAAQAELKAANERAAQAEAALAAKDAPKQSRALGAKVSAEAKVLSVYLHGTRRPFSPYASQWFTILRHVDAIKAFVIVNANTLAWKAAADKAAVVAAYTRELDGKDIPALAASIAMSAIETPTA